MKRIILILTGFFLAFVAVTVIHASISFRLSGPVVWLRLILGTASFIFGGGWILLSLLGIPRAILSMKRHRLVSPDEYRWARRALFMGLAPFLLIGTLILLAPRWCVVRMPGESYSGPLPTLTPEQTGLRDRLKGHITQLAVNIGDRNAPYQYRRNQLAAAYITQAFSNAGFAVRSEPFVPKLGLMKGRTCQNLVVEIRGTRRPDEIVVIGGHYDTADGTPGANDNASGVAATIELARTFAHAPCSRTLRFVAFANEEPPFFWTQDMGSMVHAAGCRARNENIVAMMSLETIGCYKNEPGSQHYPTKVLEWFYPTTGNFIGFIGNTSSGWLVHDAVATFRQHARFPSQGAALPAVVSGVGWSDHWSFWEHGYSAIEVTDTAPFRYAYYHDSQDTPDKLDFDHYAYVVSMLEPVITNLANDNENR